MGWSTKYTVGTAIAGVAAGAAVVALIVSGKACSVAQDSNNLASGANRLATTANAIAQKGYDLAVHSAQPDFLLETEPLGLNLKPGPLKIVARLKNVGPTTAFRVVVFGSIELSSLTSPQAFHVPKEGNVDIEPQGRAPVPFRPELTLTADDIRRLKAGTISLGFSVHVQSDPVSAATTNLEDRPFIAFRRFYDRFTGNWGRAFPGGNPAFATR